MAVLLRKILPVVPPAHVDDDDDDDDVHNVEYSFAMEYPGPPVSYDIPRVVPIDVKRVPVAVALAATSASDDISLPVIQPIAKPAPLSKNWAKELKESKLGEEPSVSLNDETPFEQRAEEWHDISCKQSEETPLQTLASDNQHVPTLIDGAESSETVCFTESGVNSHESSECSDIVASSQDCKGSTGFHNYLNPVNLRSSESAPGSQLASSEISSCDENEHNSESHCNTRTSVVTFRYPESRDVSYEDPDSVEGKNSQNIEWSEKKVRKGSCYRCLRGIRFTKKEACLVCGVKYCKDCVLRAMGSMPEGRKCITCIGYPVKESKRRTMGKGSSMLRQLFSEIEIRRILKSEVVCEANCPRADLVIVNGKPLCQEEMVLLQSCSNPPKKLKPGNYWYDKVSGLWGKEGKKPCQIITPELNVGDQIKKNASNGNTNVLINNREITKAEVWMLKSAGVQCTGSTSYWVSADGFCQEEGHKNVKGPIWVKTGTKMVCAALSLPVPPDFKKKEKVNTLGIEVVPSCRILHKLLLFGHDRSGTSTLYKQAKFLYNIPFSEEERQSLTLLIQSNLYAYLGVLLEGRQRFEKESLIAMGKTKCADESAPSGNNTDHVEERATMYAISSRLQSFSDWLLKVRASGNLEVIFPAATREYAPFVEELWRDTAIQATYKRRNELDALPRVANYFLHRAVEISRTDYEPSDKDILYAEGMTSSNALMCIEFSYPQSSEDDSMDHLYQHDPSSSYQLIRVQPKILGENCKWLEMFADTEVVMFCVALTDYSQFVDDNSGVRTNKMMASKKLFESIATHSTFREKNFLLILNKLDLLEEMIEEVPLNSCEWLSDFNPVLSVHSSSNSGYGNPSLAQRAAHYIGSKFKKLFYTLTERKLYVSFLNGLNADKVDEALRYAREILRWEEEKPNFSPSEWSSCSMDVSTTS